MTRLPSALLDKDKSRLPVAIKDVIIIGVGVVVVWLGIWFVFGANPFYVVSSGEHGAGPQG